MRRQPKISRNLLRFLIDRTEHYSLYGDIEEMYNETAVNNGRFYAFIWYMLQLIKAIAIYMNRSFFQGTMMFKNYIRVSARNLIRNKTYSVINISGLSVGIACFMLIMSFVFFEYSYDNFHENGDRLYRIVEWQNTGGRNPQHVALTMGPLAKSIREDFPEVERSARIRRTRTTVKIDNKIFPENNVLWASPEFFEMFSFRLLAGNREDVITEPGTAVISQNAAVRYFGTTECIGETFIAYDNEEFKVTGIVEDVPENSHLYFNVVLSFITVTGRNDFLNKNWGLNSLYTYILLAENTDPRNFSAKMPEYINSKFEYLQKDEPYWNYLNLNLQPLEDIHLKSTHLNYDLNYKKGNLESIISLTGVAILVLILACMNYINLSTAKSSVRVKEVGIRKVVGAGRGGLISQFLGESILLTAISVILGSIIVYSVFPFFREYTGKEITIDIFNLRSILLCSISTLILGIISGSYPAFILSSFSPGNLLKKSMFGWRGRSSMRKTFVTSQFAISSIIIAFTMVIFSQIKYLLETDPGYNRDHLLVIELNNVKYDKMRPYMSELRQIKGITSISSSSSVPGEDTHESSMQIIQPSGVEDMSISLLAIDHNFLDTFGIEVIKGRNFLREFTTDTTSSIIINESFAKLFNWDDPIDKVVKLNGSDMKVIGVIGDYHYESLHHNIEPLAVIYYSPYRSYITLKVDNTDLSETIGKVKEISSEIDPDNPLKYYFLDESIQEQYSSEQQLGQLFKYFSVLAVFIASLGLFGLAAFTAERRTHEIGVRKVLGASGIKVFYLLSSEFLLLIFISNIIAVPAVFLSAGKWLDKFAYRVEPDWIIFTIPVILTFIAAIISVGFQSLKASLINPSDSLRYE